MKFKESFSQVVIDPTFVSVTTFGVSLRTLNLSLLLRELNLDEFSVDFRE